MLVFADAERWLEPALALAHVQARLSSSSVDTDGALDVLLTLGELYQGVLDRDLQRDGAEASPDKRAALSEALHAAAEMYVATLDGRGKKDGLRRALSRVHPDGLPRRIRARTPEGFAHYALLPQLYVSAARRLSAGAYSRVLGIRTAGVVLGAVVAAALRAPPLLSVRPEGDPFSRHVRASLAFKQALQRDAGARWLIADEGPGQSGSSFLAAARLLEDCGVDRGHIVLLPSHAAGPGPAASPPDHERWSGYSSTCVSFAEHFQRGLPFMASGSAPASGAQAIDLCGGRWRPLLHAPGELPPSLRAQERLKYLIWRDGAPKLAKFAGLGRWGQKKLRRARCLSAAGFIAAPDALESGFLIEDWLAGSRPAAVHGAERAACLDFLGRYLSFVSTQVAARDDWGADPSELSRMVERNTRLSLGPRLANIASARVRQPPPRGRPVYVDGKLEPWEWLTSPRGLRKTDALDHAAGHDLVRAQDIEWDVAGARIELGLAPGELGELVDELSRRGAYRPQPRRLAFFSLCYLAFKIGVYTLGESSEANPTERERLRLRRAFYEEHLRRELLRGR